MKYNAMMAELIKNDGETPSEKEISKIDSRLEKLFGDLRFENGCLFLSTYNGVASAENVADKAEFEAWHNEILINSEFPTMKITPAFAMRFFARFNERLRSEYGERICAVMSEDEGRWTYRFHIVREGEPLWISEDLEKFAQPIVYDIYGEKKDAF